MRSGAARLRWPRQTFHYGDMSHVEDLVMNPRLYSHGQLYDGILILWLHHLWVLSLLLVPVPEANLPADNRVSRLLLMFRTDFPMIQGSLWGSESLTFIHRPGAARSPPETSCFWTRCSFPRLCLFISVQRHFCLCIRRHALPLSVEGADFRTRDLDEWAYPDLILKSSIINSSSDCIFVFFLLCRKNKTSLQQACPSKPWPSCEQGYGLFLTRRL